MPPARGHCSRQWPRQPRPSHALGCPGSVFPVLGPVGSPLGALGGAERGRIRFVSDLSGEGQMLQKRHRVAWLMSLPPGAARPRLHWTRVSGPLRCSREKGEISWDMGVETEGQVRLVWALLKE